MGLNHLSTAAVIALLGAATALHAETATEISAAAEAPANAAALLKPPSAAPAAAPAPETEPASAIAATSPAEDPALKASPIAGTTPSEAPAAQPEPAPVAQPSAPEMAPPVVEPAAPAEPAPVIKGDVLTVPKSAPAPASKKTYSGPISIEVDGMPGRGTSMAQVIKHFGEPQQKVAPVGEPPITRWIYRDYTVYFEHEYVIHSVRNDGSAAPKQPAAAPSPTTETPPASGQ